MYFLKKITGFILVHLVEYQKIGDSNYVYCDVVKFTRHLKRFFLLNSPVWQVGLCPGEKVVWPSYEGATVRQGRGKKQIPPILIEEDGQMSSASGCEDETSVAQFFVGDVNQVAET